MIDLLKTVPSQVMMYFISFIIAAAAGRILIPLLKRLKFSQVVREEGPESHKYKTGTATMGGIIFLIPVVLLGTVYGMTDARIFPLILVTVGFAFVGFMDDYLKIVRKNNKGLSPRQKMIGLLIVSGIFTWYSMTYINDARTLILPFLGYYKPVVMPLVLAVPFCLFVLVAFTNAVNLTDGLDGLAGSVTTIVLLFFTIVTMFNSQWDYIRIFCSILAGGILGFLVYNLHPAKVFMGDTGALAIGGALSAVAIFTGTPVFLGLAGIIFVIETLSVMIQVIYFKRTGKRVFLMAPLHHHFEQKGWSEIKVVSIFTIITIFGSILAFLVMR